MTGRWWSCVALAVLLACGTRRPSLEDQSRAVLSAYAAAGLPVARPPSFFWVDLAAMAASFAREADRREERLRAAGVDAAALQELGEFARRAARAAVARYEPETNRVLVCRENLRRAARARDGRDERREEERLLRGALLHEVGHARLEAVFPLERAREAVGSARELGALSLWIEAAAEALAERAAGILGAEADLASALEGAAGSPEGEAFLDALEHVRSLMERAGETALWALFERPLRALEEAGRTTGGGRFPLDAEAAFGPFLVRFSGFESERFETRPEAIRASLRFLPEAEADALARGVEGDRSLRLRREREARPQMVGVSLRAHRDESAAAGMFQALFAAFRAQEGLEVEPFSDGATRGFLVLSVGRSDGGPSVVSSFAVRRTASLSLLLQGPFLTQEDVRALMVEALRAACGG